MSEQEDPPPTPEQVLAYQKHRVEELERVYPMLSESTHPDIIAGRKALGVHAPFERSILAIIQEHNARAILRSDDSNLAAARAVQPEKAVCSVCEGRGWVPADYSMDPLKAGDREVCHYCLGSGAAQPGGEAQPAEGQQGAGT